MIKYETISNYIKPRLIYAKMEFNKGMNEVKDIHGDMFSQLKNLRADIKESFANGEVHTSGVTDDKAKNLLDGSKDGLETYAKTMNINISFHTPQKPYEYGSNDFEKPLVVSVYSKKGFFNTPQIDNATIDGDTDKITKFITSKNVKSGDKFVKVDSTQDETFLRRVYRAVQTLKERMKTSELND